MWNEGKRWHDPHKLLHLSVGSVYTLIHVHSHTRRQTPGQHLEQILYGELRGLYGQAIFLVLLSSRVQIQVEGSERVKSQTYHCWYWENWNKTADLIQTIWVKVAEEFKWNWVFVWHSQAVPWQLLFICIKQ